MGSKANKSAKEYAMLVEDLRKQLKENNLIAQKLQIEYNKAAQEIPGGVSGLDKLKGNIQDLFQQKRAIEVELKEIEFTQDRNSKLCDAQHGYHKEIKEKLHKARQAKQNQERANYNLHTDVNSVNLAAKQLDIIAQEVKTMERHIISVTSEPFMNVDAKGFGIAQSIADEERKRIDLSKRIEQTTVEERTAKAMHAEAAKTREQLRGARDQLKSTHRTQVDAWNEQERDRVPQPEDAARGLL